MARMLSHIGSVIRGSVGGLTYFSGPYHQIQIRHRTSPVNPSTLRQGQIRGSVATANVLWLGLTEPNRILWDAYADTVPYEGPLGSYTLPGKQIFVGNIGLAQYLMIRGAIMTVTTFAPPVNPGFLSFIPGTPAAPTTGTGFKISFTNYNTESVVVFGEISIAFNPTRYRYKGPFMTESMKYAVVAGAGVGTLEFVGLTVGKIYFVKLRLVCGQDPVRISGSVILRAVAVTSA